MSTANVEIKGLKSEIQLESLDNKNGWKELLSIVKNNKGERELDIRSKYLSKPSEVVPNAIEETLNYRNCNACNKPILLSTLLDHLENHCVNRATNKENKDSPNLQSPGKNKENVKKRSVSIDLENMDSPSKKEDSSSLPPQKKQRKIKQRNPTEPHLVNFDKQCGVPLSEGGVCGRSLTCKSHSMGAKRAVEGRSQPFDVLLADYQKRNQLKSSASKTRVQKAQQNQHGVQNKQKPVENDTAKDNNMPVSEVLVPLTPEEETTQVLNGVSRSYPLPLEYTVLSSTRSRIKYIRMREMFASAFSIKPGFKSPGVGAFRSRVGLTDVDRSTDYTFRIRTPQAVGSSPQNLTPEQLQALQAQRLKQQQMIAQQQEKQKHQQKQAQQSSSSSPPHQPFQQTQHQMQLGLTGSNNNISAQPTMPMQEIGNQQHPAGHAITPRDIQTQQQVMQQQQQKLLQKRRMEDASAQLDTASKLMQHSIGSPVNIGARSSPDQSLQMGLNGYGGRVN